jgi:hypothetical protein
MAAVGVLRIASETKAVVKKFRRVTAGFSHEEQLDLADSCQRMASSKFLIILREKPC